MAARVHLRANCRWLRWFGVVVLLAICGTWCRAGSPNGKPSTTDSRENRMLMLISGRIVEGKISQSAGGYLVEKPKGSMLIPFEHVKLEAANRREAYHKLRKTLPERTATNHTALARWCVSQQLLDEARIELRDALELEPNRAQTRSMLRRLDALVNSDQQVRVPTSSTHRLVADGFERREVKSLAGLSRESAQQFVLRIQPILMNKCGNASCHAAGVSNTFRLTRIRSGRAGNRVFAERNLATTLRFVDFDQPDRSQLLQIPKGNHGRGNRTVFYGSRGPDQLAALRDWVHQVAKERAEARDREPAKASLDAVGTAKKRQPNGKTPAEIRKRDQLPKTATANAVPKPDGGEDDILETILREERQDAFDPDAFNRAVHGKKRKEQ